MTLRVCVWVERERRKRETREHERERGASTASDICISMQLGSERDVVFGGREVKKQSEKESKLSPGGEKDPIFHDATYNTHTDTHTHRQTDRQTHTHTDRHTDRQRDR